METAITAVSIIIVRCYLDYILPVLGGLLCLHLLHAWVLPAYIDWVKFCDATAKRHENHKALKRHKMLMECDPEYKARFEAQQQRAQMQRQQTVNSQTVKQASAGKRSAKSSVHPVMGNSSEPVKDCHPAPAKKEVKE